MEAPALLFLILVLAVAAATGFAVSKMALDPRTAPLRRRFSLLLRGSHAVVTVAVEDDPGADRSLQPGGRVLVLRNEGAAPAHNLRAVFASMSRPTPYLDFLRLQFPIPELPPGAEARIPLTSRKGVTVGSFRMTWDWRNSEGKESEARTAEFS